MYLKGISNTFVKYLQKFERNQKYLHSHNLYFRNHRLFAFRYFEKYLTPSLCGLQEDDESLEPLWYVLDEFGSRVQHSDTPTSRTVPFHHIPTKVTYTLMWPITDLDFEGA